ncbi:MAG: helix-turn-helix transcriptional regulator [Pseudomonadota bacterium]
MMQHGDVWRGVDLLAQKHGLSASGLAKLAGLDATAFNKSKRTSKDGRPRWPSTESISLALAAVGEEFTAFAALISGEPACVLPRLSTKDLHAPQVFDQNGRPVGKAWQNGSFPVSFKRDHLYVLEVHDTSLEPTYRRGDQLVVSPHIPAQAGNRVVVRSHHGDVLIGLLEADLNSSIHLKSLSLQHGTWVLDRHEVAWMARIVWLSQ